MTASGIDVSGEKYHMYSQNQYGEIIGRTF